MTVPLVSVCIPTRNGEPFLEEALRSVLDQTFPHLEVVASDDSSEDGTRDVLTAFARNAPFPVRVLDHRPTTIGANWNHCLRAARGDYVKFLFQDDLLRPGCITRMLEVFRDHPEVGLVACKRDLRVEDVPAEEAAAWIDRCGDLQRAFGDGSELMILDRSFLGRRDFLDPPANKIGEPSSVMLRRRALDRTGGFDESLHQVLDYVLYYRLLRHHPIAVIAEPLTVFRLHGRQATSRNRDRMRGEFQAFQRILLDEFPGLLHPAVRARLESRFRPASGSGTRNRLRRLLSRTAALLRGKRR